MSTHQHTINRKPSITYNSWAAMKSRCNSPTNTRYRDYGGRGIKVCPQWNESFEAFLADVGERPTRAHTLDRLKNELGYQPGNVRWATAEEQSNNQRDTVRLTMGELSLTVAQWARRQGMSRKTLVQRLAAGMSLEMALLQPLLRTRRAGQPARTLTHEGRTMKLSAWAKEIGVNVAVLDNRKRQGWTDAAILTRPVDPRMARNRARP